MQTQDGEPAVRLRATERSAALLTWSLCAATVVLACGGGDAESRAGAATAGEIRDVVVVLKDSREPLPFDPRRGRITLVTRELETLVGHRVVLVLDTALSPELVASLEETVLASFEGLVRELTLVERDDKEMFEMARRLERVVCTYDAALEESTATLDASGKVLSVRAPPERFPLLERGLMTDALYRAFTNELDARYGEADPTRLPPRDHAAYFAYMTRTRPGAGYVWIASRAGKERGQRRATTKAEHDPWTTLRLVHVGRIVALAGVVDARGPLAKRIRAFLLESAGFLAGFTSPSDGGRADPAALREVLAAYDKWLSGSVASFDAGERLALAKVVFDRSASRCGADCAHDASFPSLDRLAFGLSVYDEWMRTGARVDLPDDDSGRLFKTVVCPKARLGEAEKEIRYGCSEFFARTLREDSARSRLAGAILKRRDGRLLETALLNLGTNEGPSAVALVDAMTPDDALFRHGVRVAFHDLARRDDVKSALEKAAPRWWRDAPARRGLAFLVLARQWEHLDVHYGDNQWRRFVAEFGGAVGREILAGYLAEGSRAVEMIPKVWLALARTADRDALVAKSLAVLLDKDRELQTARAVPVLLLLRRRLCEERNETGLAGVRAELERWSRAHATDASGVANALADFTLARCTAKEKSDSPRDEP